jgi:ATP-dependent Clp protease ATP-binding subunit ClpA
MFERFTPDARNVVVHAQQHARRLGHHYIGCEHLLLAVAGIEQPAGEVMRERGVTPDHVEQQIVRQVGLGTGADLFADLDREALAAIGIDLDAVRARIEARFGADALDRAARVSRSRRRRSRLNPNRALSPRLRRRFRRWRCARRAVRQETQPQAPPAPAIGRYRTAGAVPSGHLPFTARAKKTLEIAVQEARAQRDAHIGVQHITLGLLATDDGLVPSILSALGTSPKILRAAISNRYRQAS